MKECKDVVDVPNRFVPWDEMSRLWAIDRQNSGDCKRSNHAKAAIIKALIR